MNFSSEIQSLYPYGRQSLFCDGEDGADSVGTGDASIPNCLHLLTSDLLIAGSFI